MANAQIQQKHCDPSNRYGASARAFVDIAAASKLARGLKIYGVMIIPRHNAPPSGTNTGWNDAKTAIRNAVNQWIRTEAAFDAVIDFDTMVRQPAHPNLLVPEFNCGDGIHPSPAGFYRMGKSVSLELFQRGDD